MTQEELNKILKEHEKWLHSFERKGKKADLRGADLRGANLCDANLYGANLRGARLPKRIIQVGPIGSRSDYTFFYIDSGMVKCGCWHGKNRDEYQGGTLEEFKQRIDEVYPTSSKEERKLRYRQEYLAAIAMFEMMNI